MGPAKPTGRLHRAQIRPEQNHSLVPPSSQVKGWQVILSDHQEEPLASQEDEEKHKVEALVFPWQRFLM